MKRDTDDLDAALTELRREYHETPVPASLEQRILQASDELHSASNTPVSRIWMWTIGGALAAMLLIGLVWWQTGSTASHTSVQHDAAAPKVVPGSTLGAAKVDSEKATKSTHTFFAGNASPRPHTPKTHASEAEELRAEETETSFIPLPGSEGLPIPSDPSIVRVRLIKGDLQHYGFEVSPAVVTEPIHADFYVGEDGLPRAIRLVR